MLLLIIIFALGITFSLMISPVFKRSLGLSILKHVRKLVAEQTQMRFVWEGRAFSAGLSVLFVLLMIFT